MSCYLSCYLLSLLLTKTYRQFFQLTALVEDFAQSMSWSNAERHLNKYYFTIGVVERVWRQSLCICKHEATS